LGVGCESLVAVDPVTCCAVHNALSANIAKAANTALGMAFDLDSRTGESSAFQLRR